MPFFTGRPVGEGLTDIRRQRQWPTLGHLIGCDELQLRDNAIGAVSWEFGRGVPAGRRMELKGPPWMA